MRMDESKTYILDNFEGPLDFLLHLIQKNEIDIHEVSIRKITDQYLAKLKELMEHPLEHGAEFIGAAASLMLLKSKSMLPKHEQEGLPLEENEADPRFEIIHKLIEYCRFKEVAKSFAEREEQQGTVYFRGVDEIMEPKKNLGIEHLSLTDLAELFQQVLAKAPRARQIEDEEWLIVDKIALIRRLCQREGIPFLGLFSEGQCREELITLFLAILELMKLGEICIVREEGEVYLTKV